jgi:hypothetical protein
MDPNRPGKFRGLIEIRNGAHLLSLGNAYLCEVSFLKKIGTSMHSQIDGLKGDILALKDLFPGKFVDEIDTEAVLGEINEISLRLQNPDQELNERCTIGDLGRELETHLETLTNTIGSLRDQVEGGGLTYTKKDSFLDIFGGLRHSGSHARSGLGKAFKIIAGILVLCAIAFIILFSTMVKEKALLGKIAVSESHIRSQQEILSGLDEEKKQLFEKTTALQEGDITRQEKLEILDLEMKIHDLEERRQKVQVQIHAQENEIKKHRERVDVMKKKSFIQRLLRR